MKTTNGKGTYRMSPKWGPFKNFITRSMRCRGVTKNSVSGLALSSQRKSSKPPFFSYVTLAHPARSFVKHRLKVPLLDLCKGCHSSKGMSSSTVLDHQRLTSQQFSDDSLFEFKAIRPEPPRPVVSQCPFLLFFFWVFFAAESILADGLGECYPAHPASSRPVTIPEYYATFYQIPTRCG